MTCGPGIKARSALRARSAPKPWASAEDSVPVDHLADGFFELLLELLDLSDLLFGVLYSLEQEVLKVAVWVL